jgi:FtsH-binding integral membrane protein
MVGIICMMENPVIVFEAAGLTAAMVVGLTIYAIKTTTDFTYCGAIVWVLAMLMSMTLIMMWIVGPAMHMAYCFLGVFCYSFFLIYDTQLIVGGKHRRLKFDKDAYILASVSLYLDIINLFLFILQIMNGGRNE